MKALQDDASVKLPDETESAEWLKTFRAATTRIMRQFMVENCYVMD